MRVWGNGSEWGEAARVRGWSGDSFLGGGACRLLSVGPIWSGGVWRCSGMVRFGRVCSISFGFGWGCVSAVGRWPYLVGRCLMVFGDGQVWLGLFDFVRLWLGVCVGCWVLVLSGRAVFDGVRGCSDLVRFVRLWSVLVGCGGGVRRGAGVDSRSGVGMTGARGMGAVDVEIPAASAGMTEVGARV